jgi:hypothetical protein
MANLRLNIKGWHPLFFIEYLNRKIIKYTTNKLPLPADEAVLKSAFLVFTEATRK